MSTCKIQYPSSIKIIAKSVEIFELGHLSQRVEKLSENKVPHHAVLEFFQRKTGFYCIDDISRQNIRVRVDPSPG